MATKLSEIMQAFADETDQFIASSIFDPSSGQSIVDKSIDENYDPSISVAYMSEVIKENEKGLEAMKSNASTTDYLMTLNEVYILLKSIEGTWYYQACTIAKSGSLGMTRELMRKYESKFADELKKI